MSIKKSYFSIAILGILILSSCNDIDKREKNHVNTIKQEGYTQEVNFIGHWLNEGKREELINKLVREYEFLNQDVKVNLTFPEDIYFDRSILYSQEKFISEEIQKPVSEWDIIRIEYPPVASYMNNPNWAKDYLVDFSKIPEYVASTEPFLLTEEYKEQYWGGMLPGPFIEGQYWSLWYNKNMAEKLGLTIKSQGMTINDFSSYCKSVYDYNSRNSSNPMVAFFDADDWETTMNLAIQLLASQYESLAAFKAENKAEKLANWYKVLKAFEQISQYNIYGNDGKKSWGEDSKKVLDGGYLFYLNGSWMYNIWDGIDSEKTLNMVPAELPAFESNNIYCMGYASTWGVPKNAPNKEAAIDFLLSMNSESTAKAWVEATKSPSGIKANALNVSFGTDQYDTFSQYLSKTYTGKSYTLAAEKQDILGEKNLRNQSYHKEVLKGTMTADQAMVLIRRDYID